MKIKANDSVLIITGKNRLKTGKVIRTIKGEDRIVVEGVNLRTKHIKKTKQGAGRKIQFEAPIHVSNVKVICPETKKASRVGYIFQGKKKIRIAKKSKQELDKKVTN
ncbi:MAG: 50S ribosomal protein L24, large subunit ribosomal protein L24 [Candidatus Peregrinibacteria bacterium GW2011_GWF2_33_10]|nr:MAG: 50S ribosomal protein L24, large subunit ribosomal protein L24 [Candidatus Peregrinibacteria bacterium GW2011_GWF2_33_10]OGJ46126.1 MAG: 50S ribosomal protein L24 [Candidatus Peregrinibacteria bacterium RIFOXYA12_FULL_33_12]OGJ46168.1 MAG: 50S ribosomal protein L24 [Candidatus Peregrinibacteria bacterium RIFOXYA2_FULL_33_21]OGJ51585.1 MAG: 50S ribosomal protein L24 [Candidatus Peregrinibacteria bacterium RIFOXYB2_FULL_33_20]